MVISCVHPSCRRHRAEDMGTGSPAQQQVEMLSFGGKAEPGRIEGKGKARLGGPRGCSVPSTSPAYFCHGELGCKGREGAPGLGRRQHPCSPA